MSEIKASVVIPTSIHRRHVLPYSIRSILNQSIQEIEILIIGDGVDQDTKILINQFCEKDARIRFFDYPKSVRRGELNRHEVLSNYAKGKIVCYLNDRDLMLSNHVELMYKNLLKNDFCIHSMICVKEDGKMDFQRKDVIGTYHKMSGEFENKIYEAKYPLSCVGHTLESYKLLPFGWRETPDRIATDVYMWQQFTQLSDLRLISTMDLSILYFKRGDYPGWSALARAKELNFYFDSIYDPKVISEYKKDVVHNLMIAYNGLKNEAFVIHGKPLSKLKDYKNWYRYIKRMLRSYRFW